MKSSRQNININAGQVGSDDPLISEIKKEKETLLAMFLANASITELAAQYKLIDKLNAKIMNRGK